MGAFASQDNHFKLVGKKRRGSEGRALYVCELSEYPQKRRARWPPRSSPDHGEPAFEPCHKSMKVR